MFEASDQPRIFAQEPGADFAAALVQGLRARLADHPPEAMARVRILLNTARMRERVRAAFLAAGPGFLPQLGLVADLGAAPLPGAVQVSPLRRRLELAQMVRKLLEAEPGLAPRRAAFALAESLARLLDEMQMEAVDLARLDRLDISNHSAHWERSLRFIRLITGFLSAQAGSDPAARQRQAVERLVDDWRATPPEHPILIAGSSGSRGTTAQLMQAVARLPQGAVVLPGFDFDMPAPVWGALDDPLLNEDHPQFRFARLLRALDLPAGAVQRWAGPQAPDPARSRLVSLALRPAPVTDRWLAEGPGLGDLLTATQGLSLIEAPTPRAEALAIAFCLRDAALNGQKAALITPDRAIARQVTAALDRWHLRPDDSAGRPLGLSAPGRFLRLSAASLAGVPAAADLIALLKHPITHSATARGPHLRHTRDWELWLRRKSIPHADAQALRNWAEGDPARADWQVWLEHALASMNAATGTEEHPLGTWLARHRALAEALAAGVDGGQGAGALWQEAAGAEAAALFAALETDAEAGGMLSHDDYIALLETIIAGRAVRESAASHPDIMIWGPQEARAQDADLLVLAGLNDGVWPAAPDPDPWFNRRMRLDAGLLLPERRIGLSAHDFQQAIGARQVVLTRALRDAEAETIPSRWLNRLKNLIAGLPSQNGPAALQAMIARGAQWHMQAQRFEGDMSPVPPACARRNPRPAPAPPVHSRPKVLPVTAIKQLIRDPYHIYARHILGLRPLDPLTPQADARLRGTVLHRIVETYTRAHPVGSAGDISAFLAISETILAEDVPWHAARVFWQARLAGVADAFVRWHAETPGTPVLTERRGALRLEAMDFTLTGQPDRIDLLPDGRLMIFDYKTGQLPSANQQAHFDKQLILLALMAEDGAFDGLDAAEVAGASFVGLGAGFKLSDADVSAQSLHDHREQFARLIGAYRRREQGYAARRALTKDSDRSDYDHLSRLGEWQLSDPAQRIEVGDKAGERDG